MLNLTSETVFLGGFVAAFAVWGCNELKDECVPQVVAHHMIDDTRQYRVDSVAWRNVAVEIILNLFGDALVLVRNLKQGNKLLTRGFNCGLDCRRLGGVAIGSHQRLVLGNKF